MEWRRKRQRSNEASPQGTLTLHGTLTVKIYFAIIGVWAVAMLRVYYVANNRRWFQ